MFLAFHKELSAFSAYHTYDQDHDPKHTDDHDCQKGAHDQHDEKDTGHGNERGDQLRDPAGDHLAQRIDVVGVPAHEIAVGMCIKITDRKCFHVPEKICTYPVQDICGNVDHLSVIQKIGQDPDCVDTGEKEQQTDETGKIRGFLSDERHDVVVEDRAQKCCACDRS